jgi:hypothetical protein
MYRRFFPLIALLTLIGGMAIAEEPIDLIGGSDIDGKMSTGIGYVLEASWICADPFGEFDESLGAAGALNRALGLIFSGHASRSQIRMEREAVDEYSGDAGMAPFAVDVLARLQADFGDALPEPVELIGFDLTPSEVPVVSRDDPHIVIVRYDDEEYLERLLQRLYFKLIQGPVLLTVPYRADDPSVPDEYRNWSNFRYGSNGDTMVWDDTRLVWVDWDLVQTVVLTYEDGRIACYDSGRKYFIDHTAAVATAGAMYAHPAPADLPPDTALNYMLAAADGEE